MNWEKAFLIALCVFLLLFGLMTSTNVVIEFMKPVCGISAIVAAVIGIVSLVRK